MNRRTRLLAALSTASILVAFMLYAALAGGGTQEPVIEVQELAARKREATRSTVELVGVAAGPVTGERGERIAFRMTDMKGRHPIRVDYRGSVPDAFRPGRHVIVRGSLVSGRFRAVDNSLVTKCPSKFEDGTAGPKASSGV